MHYTFALYNANHLHKLENIFMFLMYITIIYERNTISKNIRKLPT